MRTSQAVTRVMVAPIRVYQGQKISVPTILIQMALVQSSLGRSWMQAIVAREIDRSPEAFVIAQPTRGLDVGAIEYIHKRIIAERDKGKAILLVSLELDEILDISDRIAVIYNGEIVGVVQADATDENELGLMMSGSKRRVA